MGFTLESALALFVLLTISSITFFAAKRIKLPYTVLLVAVGLLLVPLASTPLFSFLKDFTLTPELLFYIFLPTLIFESAYNIPIRHLVENKWAVSLLSIVSLIISAFFAGGVLYFLFQLLGLDIPFMLLLLFGALISATDPVAVLALFKEFGAPRRLTLLFEGESLLNDGTAVALFLVLVGIAVSGSFGALTLTAGVITFFSMLIGGIAIGIIMGGLFSKFIEKAASHEFVAITLMIVSAHLTFILTELASTHLDFFGGVFKLSPIIATTFAAMVIGNYGRYKVSLKASEFVEKFWGQFAFLANSLVFILIGLLFADLPFHFEAMLVPILLAVLVVALGRALSIYPVIHLLNKLGLETHIPTSWQHLLAWGSLRGALAITMVLLIPDTLQFAGWDHSFTPKEFVLGLTIGCIYATLFLKATTIGPLMRRLKLDTLTHIEEVAEEQSKAIIHARVIDRLHEFKEKGYVNAQTFQFLYEKHHAGLKEAHRKAHTLLNPTTHPHLADKIIRLYAIGVEKYFLKELLTYGEVPEKIFKKILRKLTLQLDQIEHDHFDIDCSFSWDKKDMFERLAQVVRNVFFRTHATDTDLDRYVYYRAQTIIARKVLKELAQLQKQIPAEVLNKDALDRVTEVYREFKNGSETKMELLATESPEAVNKLNLALVTRGLLKTEEAIIQDLYEKEMITPKLFISLQEQFNENSPLIK